MAMSYWTSYWYRIKHYFCDISGFSTDDWIFQTEGRGIVVEAIELKASGVKCAAGRMLYSTCIRLHHSKVNGIPIHNRAR